MQHGTSLVKVCKSILYSQYVIQSDSATDRAVVENAKAEVAALHVKTENLVTKLREAELQNEANQARLKDFKASLDTSKGGIQECTYFLFLTFGCCT